MQKIKRLNQETGQWEYSECPLSHWEEMKSWVENGAIDWVEASDDPEFIPDVIKKAMEKQIEPEGPIEYVSNDLNDFKAAELKEMAKEKGLEFKGNISKKNLIKIIENAG